MASPERGVEVFRDYSLLMVSIAMDDQPCFLFVSLCEYERRRGIKKRICVLGVSQQTRERWDRVQLIGHGHGPCGIVVGANVRSCTASMPSACTPNTTTRSASQENDTWDSDTHRQRTNVQVCVLPSNKKHNI
jgi:hypothetical protein